MSVVKITAKTRFTHTLGDGTIIHMDPKDPRVKAIPTLKEREIPLEDALRFHDREFIEDFKNPATGKMVKKEDFETLSVTRAGGFPEIQSDAARLEPDGPAPTTTATTAAGVVTTSTTAPSGNDAPIAPAGTQADPTHSIKHVGAGYYQIMGPSGAIGEKIKGKEEAQAEADRMSALNAPATGVRQHPVGPTAGADTEHGNGEVEPGEQSEEEKQQQPDPDAAPTS